MFRVLFLDVETTGPDNHKHFITELAAIKLLRNYDKDYEHKKAFKASIKPPGYPDIEFTEVAEEKTGITHEMLADYHEEEEVLIKFINWLRGDRRNLSFSDRYTMVAYNADFDFVMMKRMFKRHGLYSTFRELFLPTPFDMLSYYHLIKEKYGYNSSMKLEDAAREMGIEFDDSKTHDALEDTKIMLRMFEKLEKENRLL